MKNILLLLALIFASLNSYGQGDAPPMIQGQSQTSKIAAPTIAVPGNLATKVSGGALLEMGNNNLLSNPSFEHSTFDTGWTLGSGTATPETSTVIHGKKSYKLVLALQTLSLKQKSTLYASQFNGSVQGLGYIRALVPSGVTAKLCAIQASTTSSTLCHSQTGDGTWKFFKIPFILSATDNGIELKTDSAVSGTFYIDDAFVGAQDVKQDVDASRIAGESYFAATASCTGSTSSTTVGPLTTNAACPGPTIATTNNLGDWQTTDANLFRQTINNLPAGKYKATFQYYGYQGVGSQSSVSITDGTTTCEPIGAPSDTGANTPAQVSCVFTYAQSGNRYFELVAGVASGGGLTIYNSYTNPKTSTKFTLEYFNNTSTYSSTNADTDWAACNFSTLAWQGLGTVTNNLKCKRQGSDLLMVGLFTNGTLAAAEARIPLPLWNGQQLTTAGTSVIPNTVIAGRIVRSQGSASSAKDFSVLMSPSFTYLNIGYVEDRVGANPLTPQQGATIFSGSETEVFEARIPIQGWENSNVMVAQLSGLESCASTDECTPSYTTYVTDGSATTTLSRQNVSGWVTGCTNPSAGTYVCSFASDKFTATPNCECESAHGDDDFYCNAYAETTGQVSIHSGYYPGTLADTNFKLSCEKTGSDYIGKTAKAVASDQNLRSPSVVNGKFCGASVSNTGVISNEFGECFNGNFSDGSGTGSYAVTFNSGTFTSFVECGATGKRTDSHVNIRTVSVSTSGATVQVSAAAPFSVHCWGI